MSILLPSKPAVQTAAPYLIDAGGLQRSDGGGPDLRLNRLGNRFGIDMVLPSMRSDTLGRVYVSRLLQAVTQGALVGFVQDYVNRATGAPVINGSGQLGSALQLHGFDPNVPIVEGQFFSIIYAGRRYLHHVTADTMTDAAGAALIGLNPMLRISPNDGAICEFQKPMIEGFLANAQQLKWQLQTAPYADLKFTIEEAQ